MENPIATFEGLSGPENRSVQGCSWSPSDCIGDIGPNHDVEAVNNLDRIFNRSGKPLMPPAKYSALFAGLGEPASKYDNGDPVVRYDRMADRWVVTAFVVGDGLEGLCPARTVVGVSKTPDPTGPSFRYDFPIPNNNLKTTEQLTSPFFEASRHRNLMLHFVRWLTIERGLRGQANVEVSTHGADWTRVRTNPAESSLNTKAWVPQTVQVPSWTDGSPTVQICSGMGPTDTSRTAGGMGTG